MRLILQCKQLGMLNSTKKKLYKGAWDKVASEMNSQYSTTRYTPSNIETKYDTERKRYRTWKALYEISGVGVNYQTGVLETSDEKWQDFVAKFGRSNPRNIQWLITTPLDDRDVYETGSSSAMEWVSPKGEPWRRSSAPEIVFPSATSLRNTVS